MKAALQKPEHQQLQRCGFPGYLRQYPAPAVGGPVLDFHVLDLVTENDSADDLPKSRVFELIDQSIGVLRLGGLAEAPHAEPVLPITKGYVFIAMPMIESDPMLDDVHEAIKAVADELGFHAERVDDPNSSERITGRVIASIRNAEHVVVDLTHGRPNVYFEAGYAHALGEVPIYVARKETPIEFDLREASWT